MESATILIDEFGNTHLELSKKGTFSHFIYTSICIRSSAIPEIEKIRKVICKKHRLNDNLRGQSSALGEKYFDRRLNVLRELCELDFSIDVLVVDKARIDSEGLKHKKSFYKYFQKVFVRTFEERYDEYDIISEKVGEEFATELNAYMQEKAFELDLFTPIRTYKLADKQEKLLQIPDFIANCVGKIFCTSHSHDRAVELWEIIAARTTVNHFPLVPPPKPRLNSDPVVDAEIWKIGNEAIERFKAKTNNESDKLRTVSLLQNHSYIQSERFIPTHEILFYLQMFYPEINEERVRKIIRDLRYEGLFIVSQAGKGGYKFATCYEDISDNIKHFLRYVIPMIQKLKVLNDTLRERSHNGINPVEKDGEFSSLKSLFEALN